MKFYFTALIFKFVVKIYLVEGRLFTVPSAARRIKGVFGSLKVSHVEERLILHYFTYKLKVSE